MAEGFNPYREWLAWKGEGPPDHYQLLALTRFESRTEAIALAAERAAGRHRSEIPEPSPCGLTMHPALVDRQGRRSVTVSFRAIADVARGNG